MTLEEGLRAYLLGQSPVSALIGQRFMPNPLTQTAQLPAVSYSRVSAAYEALHDGPQGLPTVRMQLDCWGAEPSDARAAAKAIRDAAHAKKFLAGDVSVTFARVANELEIPEPITQRWRVVLDLLIQFKEQ